MSLHYVKSFVAGRWIAPDVNAREIENPITGDVMAYAGCNSIDFNKMLHYARTRGGPALRALRFHERARLLKSLATALNEHKQALYDISFSTGATRDDHRYDIDGGIGTAFVYASKGRRELPDDHVYLDGSIEALSKSGRFVGRHICTPLQGVALQINAFNFPVWGMMEKFAPALLAGVPVIVKPATATCYVTELAVKLMLETGYLPEGALQLVTGGLDDTLDRLTCQDVVSFTGSADTAFTLRSSPNILRNSIRFVAEQDSLNATLLGPDIHRTAAEFNVFLNEIVREITTKAGQKCTAIRRIFVPQSLVEAVIDDLRVHLGNVVIGDPRNPKTNIGPLVSSAQKHDVLRQAAMIESETERVFGDRHNFDVVDGDADTGAFVSPMLFYCKNPSVVHHVHETEAFGPVATIMGYHELDEAIELVNRGGGSLVASVVTRSPEVARHVTLGAAAFHGRLYFTDHRNSQDATGHGVPLPHMLHGGPGRAGGGEELGGIRALKHYMQRTAIQGSPDILSEIGNNWVSGATERFAPEHPFRRCFSDLELGETLWTPSRVITLKDIKKFAEFTGDMFYAHMDDAAARRNPFFSGRVAHGYLLLSFAAGLFVDPHEGPVLANTGLDCLRFTKPVVPGDSIHVGLTVRQKTPRNTEYGEVRWHVTIRNQDKDIVAEYELLTMNAIDNVHKKKTDGAINLLAP